MIETSVKLARVTGALLDCLQTARSNRQAIVLDLPSNISGNSRPLPAYVTYLHAVACIAADVIELLPQFSPGLKLSAVQLRQLEEVVRADTTIQSQADSMLASLRQVHRQQGSALERGDPAAQRGAAALDNPCTSANVRTMLVIHGQPLLDLVQPRLADGRQRPSDRLLGACARSARVVRKTNKFSCKMKNCFFA